MGTESAATVTKCNGSRCPLTKPIVITREVARGLALAVGTAQ